ncbi:MAG: tRNA (adenosine(37)-N6)-threonylcarbamoyltransferase complex dimerization subunit type 1 TsaB [Planctomycetota bacterium]|jgi:tRNA threonylcarbamoyladenosine biosynthesis protein TsaB
MTEHNLTLAVETSGRIGSIAIATANQLLAETFFSAPMVHSREIFPKTAVLLEKLNKKPNQIGQIHISAGPGSFTGLRIAVALAKSMNLAINAKIVAVNTMDVIAENINDYEKNKDTEIPKFATILDAKRGKFFVAAYKKINSAKGYEKILDDSLMSCSQFLDTFATTKPIWLTGEGLVHHKEKFIAKNIHFIEKEYWPPHAKNVHKLGCQLAKEKKFTDPLTLKPNYLLRPEAEIKWQQKKT